MKKKASLLLALITPFLVVAQKLPKNQFETEVKIITNGGDTVAGKAIIFKKYKWNDFSGTQLSNLIKVTEPGKKAPTRFRPSESKGFLIRTWDGTWAQFVSSAEVAFQTKAQGFLRTECFMLKVVQGPLSLYRQYTVRSSPGYNGVAMVHEEIIDYLVKTSGELFHKSLFDSWKKKLVEFIGNCPSVVKPIEEGKYDRGDYQAVAEEYNRSCGSTS